MNLTELQKETISRSGQIWLETMGRETRTLDVAQAGPHFQACSRRMRRKGEDSTGDGVLDDLQDGFGFLRSPFQLPAGPDDIYGLAESNSPFQSTQRRLLFIGDPPTEGWRHVFRLLKVGEIHYDCRGARAERVLFEKP